MCTLNKRHTTERQQREKKIKRERRKCNNDMEFALGNLSLLQQEIICFISYTLCVSRREWLTCFQWAASLFVSLSVQLQACACACNTCTLAFCLVHRFIVVVKISCGCYVFVIFFVLSLTLASFSRSPFGGIVFPAGIPIPFTFQRIRNTLFFSLDLLFSARYLSFSPFEATKML